MPEVKTPELSLPNPSVASEAPKIEIAKPYLLAPESQELPHFGNKPIIPELRERGLRGILASEGSEATKEDLSYEQQVAKRVAELGGRPSVVYKPGEDAPDQGVSESEKELATVRASFNWGGKGKNNDPSPQPQDEEQKNPEPSQPDAAPPQPSEAASGNSTPPAPYGGTPPETEDAPVEPVPPLHPVDNRTAGANAGRDEDARSRLKALRGQRSSGRSRESVVNSLQANDDGQTSSGISPDNTNTGDKDNEPSVPSSAAPPNKPPRNNPSAPSSSENPEPNISRNNFIEGEFREVPDTRVLAIVEITPDIVANPEIVLSPEFEETGVNWALEYTRRLSKIDGIVDDPIERERREQEYLGYYRVLDMMAQSKQFNGEGIEELRIQQRLVKFDAGQAQTIGGAVDAEGNNIPAETRRAQFLDLLDQLDNLEYNEKSFQGALDEYKEFSSDLSRLPHGEESEYKRRTEGKAEIERELIAVRRGIEEIVGAEFLAKRKEIQGEIDVASKKLSEEKDKREDLSGELKDEGPSPFELRLEAMLMGDRIPTLEIKSLQQIDKFADIEKKKDAEMVTVKGFSDGMPDREVTAGELKEWYFYEARKLGFLTEADSQLKESFEGIRARIRDTNNDLPEGAADRFLRLFNSGQNGSMSPAGLQESDMSWGISAFKLQMTAGMSEEAANAYVDHFKGIRRDFMVRGVKQAGMVTDLMLEIRKIDMNEILKMRGDDIPQDVQRQQRVLQERRKDLQSQLELVLENVKINRLAGGFDVVELELNARKKEERNRSEMNEKPFDYQWRYVLKGRDREGIEFSANAAVDSLLEGAASFDVNTLIQRMNGLSEAVAEFGTPAKMSETEIKYLQRTIINRISFHLGQWFGTLVQMDSAAAITANWAGNDGYDRLQVIPTMIDGLAGKALELRYRPEYRMAKRLEGYAGQLYKNQLTQRFIRGNLEELMIDDLMRYEIKGEKPEDKYKARMKLNGRMTKEEFDRSFVIGEHPRVRLLTAKKDYDDYLADVKKITDPSALNMDLLRSIRRARQQYNDERKGYNEIRRRAKAAVEFSGKVLDFFMESAKIGAPSIRMENRMKVDPADRKLKPEKIDVNDRSIEIKGDHMSIEDVTLILEYSVMQEAKRLQGVLLKEYGIDMPDTGALLRWRFRRFLDGKESRNEDIVEVQVIQSDGTKKKEKRDLNDIFGIVKKSHGHKDSHVASRHDGQGHHDSKDDLKLRPGFETTGFTNSEFLKLVNTFKELKKHGYQATIDGKAISQILKEMKGLAPVLNNYIGQDLQGIDYFLHEQLIKQSKKGRQPFIDKLRKRLQWFGLDEVMKDLPGLSVSQQRERMEQVVENSRSFHDTITEMVYYLGTRANIDDVLDPSNYHEITHSSDLPEGDHDGQFGVKGIYEDLTQYDDKDFIFGFPNITLGHKRIKYLNANWMLRKQERIARGIAMLPFMRIYAPNLSEDLGGEDLLEVIWNMDKDYFDMPWLMGWAERMKNAANFRTRGETRINGENLRTEWGFFDKLLVDAENLRSLFANEYALSKAAKGVNDYRLHGGGAEKAVEEVIKVLGRYVPMLQLMDKTLAYDRDGGGSGASDESLQKNALRFLGWLLSQGGSSRRMQGGLQAHSDTEAIIKIILSSTSYRHEMTSPEISQFIRQKDKSIWERVWEKIKPRTPGVSYEAPIPSAIVE